MLNIRAQLGAFLIVPLVYQNSLNIDRALDSYVSLRDSVQYICKQYIR